ncbi:MAG TPA: hypothetical protein VK550_04360 [Polyangiaceae bacterium]|nr:hypothetical protein [Polyangiaceae bacterium]
MSLALRSTLPAAALCAALAFAPSTARAQMTGGTSGGWSTGTGAQGWSPIPSQPPPYLAPSRSTEPASSLEIGTLYGFSAGYGVGTGIWLDAELDIEDPGTRFLPPVILGLAAPVGVFFLDRPRMPRGMPAAISMGMAIGAGEGVGIASYQFVIAKEGDGWGFRGFSRAVFIGSTAGTALGTVAAFTMEPSPKTSLLLGSGVGWGMLIGSAFGYGSSQAHSAFGDANDTAALGGLIGYNAGLAGAAVLSTVWVPSYTSLAWMWMGFGGGVAISLPVYLFYMGGDHDPRRGLIFQGTAATLGLIAGAVFTMDSRDVAATSSPSGIAAERPPTLQVTGGGLMPVPGGVGFTVSGLLF